MDSCRGFSSLPGPLQTVERAEFLQAWDAVHLGVNNPNVFRQVGRLLDGAEQQDELMNDGDLDTLVRKMIERSGDAVRITKVKGMLVRIWCRLGG